VVLGVVLIDEGNQVYYYKAGGVQPLLSRFASPNPGIQLRVLQILSILANNDKMELIVKKVGVLRRLVPLIQTNSPLLKIQALQSVVKFSSRSALRVEMEESGVMEVLLGVYADPLWIDKQEVLLEATSALANFVLDSNAEKFPRGRLGSIVPFLSTGFADLRVELVKCLSRILRSKSIRLEFLQLRGLPRLFQALASDVTNDDLQLYSLTALIALGDEGGEVLDEIGRTGIIEHMAEDTLTSNSEDVQRHSLQLCSMLSTRPELKERFASAEAVAHLVELAADSSQIDMQEHALLAISNLADNERCRVIIGEEEGLYALLMALERTKDLVLERVMWALSYFALEGGSQKDMIEMGLSAIIRHVSHPKLAIQSLALKSLLLLLRNAENRQAIIATDGEEKLRALTFSSNRTVAAASAKALELLYSPS